MSLVDCQDGIDYATSYLVSNKALMAILGMEEGQDEIELQFLGHGEHNRNFWFVAPDGNKYVLRINVVPQVFHKDQVGYEFAALRYLQASGCVPKALYLDNSHDLIDEGVLLISFCEGQELDFDNLREGDLRNCARLMAELHAVPVDADCTLYRPKDPLRSLFDECLQRFKVYRSSDVEDHRITRWTERLIAKAQPLLDIAFSAQDCNHIINTETLPSHFLLPENPDEASGHPGYFVDWERPIIGEVAQDIAYFTAPTSTFWDSELCMTYEQAQEVVKDYWEAVDGRFERGSFDARFKAYRAMTALRSHTWFCKALLTYRKGGHTHTTSKTYAKFDTYLSDEFLEFVESDCFGC